MFPFICSDFVERSGRRTYHGGNCSWKFQEDAWLWWWQEARRCDWPRCVSRWHEDLLVPCCEFSFFKVHVSCTYHVRYVPWKSLEDTFRHRYNKGILGVVAFLVWLLFGWNIYMYIIYIYFFYYIILFYILLYYVILNYIILYHIFCYHIFLYYIYICFLCSSCFSIVCLLFAFPWYLKVDAFSNFVFTCGGRNRDGSAEWNAVMRPDSVSGVAIAVFVWRIWHPYET